MTTPRTGRLLVTGATGFVGSAACRAAVRRGWEVCGVSRRAPSLTAPDGVMLCQVDLTIGSVASVLSSFRPTLVVHAAGPASVSGSFTNPDVDFAGSVLAWQHLLEAVRRSASGVPVVYVSSAAVYGQPISLPVAESAAGAPVSPYGAHKLICELLADEYSRFHGVPTVCARIFSLVGPGQRRLLAWDLMRQILGEDPVVRIRGTGKETRDFLHVDDAVSSLLQLGSCAPAPGEMALKVNVASGTETSVAELAQQLLVVSGRRKAVHYEGLRSAGDPQRWAADTRVISSLLPDWSARPLRPALEDCCSNWRQADVADAVNVHAYPVATK